MRVMNRLAGVCLLAAAVMGTGAAAFAKAPEKSKSDRVVVMISLDGLAGFYMDDPKAEMPNIRKLAEEGARAESMRAVAPTVTWPNHTTLVTGDYTAKHGVVGNNYYDRATGKPVQLIGDPIFDKDQIVHVPTIYDLAKSAGMRTAAVSWPATRNAKTLDWKGAKPEELAEAGLTPPSPPNPDPGVVTDDGRTAAFDLILRKRHPNLALLHLSNVDHVEHKYGPRSPEAYVAIKEVDRQVGLVWAELKRDFPGKATLVVVSDHGFSPIEHAVFPNVILRQAGLIDVKGPRVVGGSVAIVPQGGSAMLYITDKKDPAAVVERVKKAFDGAQGVAKVVGPEGMKEYGFADPKDDPHAPDMILFAKEGWMFGDTAAGALPFAKKPERSGTHGHDPLLPDLHATFVAWGAGIKPGTKVGEISNTDVAPTIAKLLGIPMPGVDGKVLTDVLAK